MLKFEDSVLIISHLSPTTSFGRMALDLKKALSEEFKAEVLWLTTPKSFPENSHLPSDSHTIHAPNLKLGWWLFRRPLRRKLREMRPKKILLISQFIGFLISEIRRELPDVWIGVLIHDMFTETMHVNIFKRFIHNRFYNPLALTADCFLYNSRYTRSEAHKIRRYPADHPIIGCPIDSSVFQPCAGDKAVLRQKWGLVSYKGVCLNISFDNPRKNITTFFKLAKERPDVAFVRIGQFSQWMKDWLGENNVNNVIHFSGLPLESVVELYHCADLFIFPSFLEGFGMPPLEALACGVPVVASGASAIEENLEGVAPLINPPDRVEGYLEAVDNALSGKDIVDWKAAGKLLEKFSIEKFGERVRSCLHGKAE